MSITPLESLVKISLKQFIRRTFCNKLKCDKIVIKKVVLLVVTKVFEKHL